MPEKGGFLVLTKGLNRLAKISHGHICLRQEGLSFNKGPKQVGQNQPQPILANLFRPFVKTKTLLSQAYMTVADFGQPV
jgi:hypothetical protein